MPHRFPIAPTAPPLTVQAHSVTRALNIVGDRCSLLLLYGVLTGQRRFGELLTLTGVARSLLANRLRRLERAGLLRRERYLERPPREEYRLTEQGEDLHDVAAMILRWERRWPGGAVLPRFVHRACGQECLPGLRCAACGDEVRAREVEPLPGPGRGLDPHPGPRLQRRAVDSTDAPLRILELLGDRWTALTIAAAFYRRRRFGEFQEALGIATNLLTARLARLVELGILVRGADAREGYRLSEQGLDLFPIIVTLIRWGDRWLAGSEGPPLLLRHRPCGQGLRGLVVCECCGGKIRYGDLAL